MEELEKIVVIGGCRFIGYDLSISLANDGYNVSIIDDRRCPGAKPGDIRVSAPVTVNYDEILASARSADVIYNFYEYDGVVESRRDPAKAFEANVTIPSILYRVVARSRVQRIIHASSAAVYGEPEIIPVDENHRLEPINWYGATKLSGEILVRDIFLEKRIDVIVLRFFNVYGPGEWIRMNPGVIHYFIVNALTGGPVRVEGDGSQVRDFIHVADAVSASLKALHLPPDYYNVGSGRGVSIRQLLGILSHIHGEPLDIVIAPKRYNDVERSVADITKITTISDWKPMIPLEQGLRHLYQVYQSRIRRIT